MPTNWSPEERRRPAIPPNDVSSPLSSPPQPYTPHNAATGSSTKDLTKSRVAEGYDSSPDAVDDYVLQTVVGKSTPEDNDVWQSRASASSSSTTQLLTPQSPLAYAHVYARGNPDSPLKNSSAYPTLGSAFSPRFNNIAQLDLMTVKRPHFNRKDSSNTLQTPPASSPIEPRSGNRSHADIGDDSSSVSQLTPRGSFAGSPPRGLAPAHVITSNRGSATPSAGKPATPIPSPTKRGSVLSSPVIISDKPALLPAFGDSLEETPRSRRSDSPTGSVKKAASSRSSGAEDIVDDVFRLGRNGSMTDLKARRRPPPIGRGVDARRIQPGGSEPRPDRHKHDLRSGPSTEKRPIASSSRYLAHSPAPERLQRPAEPQAPGISLSPVKGRRIQLVRPPSPPETGLASAPSSPRTATPSSTPISAVMMKWLQSSPRTPRHAKAGASPVNSAERESRKRRRLEAFIDHPGVHGNAKQKHKSPLKPVEIKGMGRIALHPNDLVIEYVTPSKRSAKKKGGKKAAAAAPVQKKKITAFGLEVREDTRKSTRSTEDSASESGDSLQDEPHWPDDVYPWSESKRRPKELTSAEQLRLQQLEQFFDRFTDDEDSADDYDSVVATPLDEIPPDVRPKSTGGKLSSAAPAPPPSLVRSISGTSDSADARTALFARRNNRPTVPAITQSLAPPVPLDERRAEPGPGEDVASEQGQADAMSQSADDVDEDEEDEGVINCLCGQNHADTPMVRCDSCHTWSHLDCVGVHDEDQLGDEWFCFNCEQRILAEQEQAAAEAEVETDVSSSPREPMFSLTHETPRPRVIGGVNFYDPPPLTSSPLFPSNTSDVRGGVPKAPSTPKPKVSSGERSSDKLRTPTWNPRSLPDPSAVTPHTPLALRPIDARMYSTPKFLDRDAVGADNFDPTSTPSRGIQFGTPFLDSAASDRTWSFGNPPVTPNNPPMVDRSLTFSSGMTRLTKPMTYYPGSPLPSFHTSRGGGPLVPPSPLAKGKQRSALRTP